MQKVARPREQGSRFNVYVTSATALQEVRSKLLHVRKKHSDATHVSMAYRLSGINKAYDEGCVDDLEIGQGRRMLAILQKKQVTDIMIMVVRHYGGTHIGKKRFDIPADLADTAIDKYNRGRALQIHTETTFTAGSHSQNQGQEKNVSKH